MLYVPLRSLSGAPLSVSPTVPSCAHDRNESFDTWAPAKRYTPDHEVIAFDDERGVGTVAITDYAQKSLGDVVFVELPQAGTTIEQGGESSLRTPEKKCRPRPILPGS
jgi:hypothetical protein